MQRPRINARVSEIKDRCEARFKIRKLDRRFSELGLKANSAMIKRRRRLKSARVFNKNKKVVNEKTSLEKQVDHGLLIVD